MQILCHASRGPQNALRSVLFFTGTSAGAVSGRSILGTIPAMYLKINELAKMAGMDSAYGLDRFN